MIYYFVARDGFITTDESARDWFDRAPDPDIFTVRKKAKRRIKARIAELQESLEDLK